MLTAGLAEELISQFTDALLSLDKLSAKRILTEACLNLGPVQCVEQVLTPSLEHIGRGWEQGETALSQVYMSSRICEELADSILPEAPSERETIGPSIGIAVLEDNHALGKKIVASCLRAAGFAVHDFGAGLSPVELAELASANSIELLLVSVLMLPSALKVKDLKQELSARGSDARVVVGGAPFRFDDQLWLEVGADAGGKTASDAIAIVRRLGEDL